MEISALAAILFLASFTEGFVEYVFGQYERMKPFLAYVALAVGISLSIGYNIDIPSMIGLEANFGILNNIVSGIIIGRGSNYVNDVISAFRGQ